MLQITFLRDATYLELLLCVSYLKEKTEVIVCQRLMKFQDIVNSCRIYIEPVVCSLFNVKAGAVMWGFKAFE